MVGFELVQELVHESSSKIVLFVMDGLGGLPHPRTGQTELETAHTPNLDRLARQSQCGLIDPISPGMTPGSGPAHLALFGYDPLRFLIGRGVLEALGIGMEVRDGDVAARGNFCTMDDSGKISDRRAGRLATERNAQLCRLLESVSLDKVGFRITAVKEHRFALVFRGDGLSDQLTDTDPQQNGLPPLPVRATTPGTQPTADLANEFIAQARAILREEKPANMVLLRGFSHLPHLPPVYQVYKLKAAAIATYPMYRGLASLLGMQVLPGLTTLEEEVAALAANYQEYDFFYMHFKATDAAGEDGDFDRKVRAIEEADAVIPRLLALKPDVLMVTGDHSTPATLASHSWHPVPFLLHSRWVRARGAPSFCENDCALGELGRFPSVQVMPLALAHALKLDKYGA